jgi:hypothetical protein
LAGKVISQKLIAVCRHSDDKLTRSGEIGQDVLEQAAQEHLLGCGHLLESTRPRVAQRDALSIEVASQARSMLSLFLIKDQNSFYLMKT